MVTRRKKSATPKHVISASQVGTVISPIAGSLNNTSSFTGQREGKRKSYSFSEKMPPITTQVTSTRRNKDKGKGKSVILKTTPHPKSTPTFLSDSQLLSNQTHTPTREHSTPTPPIFSFGHGSTSGQMGDPSPKQDHPSGRHDHRRDSSRSHLDLGLVRSRDDEGLAKHFPTHSEEQELRVSRSLRSGVDAHSKSVVVLPHGSTSSSAPRSNDFKLLCSNLAAVPLRTLTDRARGGASVQRNCSTENLADNPDGMCCNEQHLSGEADAILHANPSLHSSDQKLNGATGTSETCNDSFPEYLEAERGVDPSMEIEGNPPPPSSTDRPFRFQPCWLNHPDFPRIVKEAWQGHNDNLSTAISEFISSAQTWNSEVFGNIFTNKRRLLARLLGIQKALARHPSSTLLQLQSNLSDELNQILNLEEELWAIKSRTNWLVSGERNTSYFHISTLTRRSANRISGIKDEVGNWLTNLEDIQAHFISGFHSLYQTDQISCQLTPPPLPCWGALLSPDEANSIASPPLDSEILSALNSMKPFKAPASTKHSICDYMGFLPTDSLGKYLGFPLLHKRQSSSDFHIITERVQAKLAGWKSKLLSPAGKLVLIQSAVTPIPEYVMQCMSVPLKVCNSIDKLCRDFLWGSTLEKRKMHLVSWKKVTVHKSLGELGIFSMRDRNKALLAKLCWRISTDHTSPWAQMLTHKYLCPSRLTPSGKKLPCSRVWAACKLGGIIFTQGIKWHIQNGNHVLFWLDWWLPSGPLRTFISGPLSPGDLSLTVADVHPFGGQWLLDKLSFVLPDHLLLELLATPFSSNPLSNDLVLWAFSSNGAFSLHSAYLLSKGFIPAKPSPSLSTSWIWKAALASSQSVPI
ncbi:reverse transcriptase [Fagus crenata]